VPKEDSLEGKMFLVVTQLGRQRRYPRRQRNRCIILWAGDFATCGISAAGGRGGKGREQRLVLVGDEIRRGDKQNLVCGILVGPKNTFDYGGKGKRTSGASGNHSGSSAARGRESL